MTSIPESGTPSPPMSDEAIVARLRELVRGQTHMRELLKGLEADIQRYADLLESLPHHPSAYYDPADPAGFANGLTYYTTLRAHAAAEVETLKLRRGEYDAKCQTSALLARLAGVEVRP